MSTSRFDPEQKQERREGRKGDGLVVPQPGLGWGVRTEEKELEV